MAARSVLTHKRCSLNGHGWPPDARAVGRAGALALCSRAAMAMRAELASAALAVISHCTPVQSPAVNRSLAGLRVRSQCSIDSHSLHSRPPVPLFLQGELIFSHGSVPVRSLHFHLAVPFLLFTSPMTTTRPDLASAAGGFRGCPCHSHEAAVPEMLGRTCCS